MEIKSIFRKNPRIFLLIAVILLSFNKPGQSYDSGWINGDPVSVYRDKEIFSCVEQLIKNAKISINIEMYEFQNWKIAELLINKSKKNVKVNVLLDSKAMGNSDIKKYLKQSGINAIYYPSSEESIDHVKLLIVDGVSALVGGANFGFHSIYNHDVAALVHGDAVVCLEAIFNNDWQYAKANKKKDVQDKSKNEGDLIKNDLRILTDKDVKLQLQKLIDDAGSSINIEVFVLSDYEIINALSYAVKRGVKVKVILDKEMDINHKSVKTIRNKGMEVKWYLSDESVAEKMHMKSAIFDKKKVILGSANFSYHGLKINHECSIIIAKNNIAEQFTNMFEQDWKKAARTAAYPVNRKSDKNGQ